MSERARGPASGGSRPARAHGARVLLVDALDAVGSDPADTQERAALLEAGGAWVKALAVSSRDVDSPRGWPVVPPGEEARRAVRSAVRDDRPDMLLFASALPPGEDLRHAAMSDLRVSWWRTGFGAPPSGGWLGRLRRVPSPPGLFDEAESSADLPGLEGGWAPPAATRRRALPIWDGELILAPAGLDGAGGTMTLDAFATLAGDWSGVDLVAWSHPLAAPAARAARLEVGPRVHQVGPSSRGAEAAWWPQARAVVITADRPLAAGLVWRALAAGTPLVLAGKEPVLARLASGLQAAGCAGSVACDATALATELGRVLEGGDEIRRRVDRGRTLAAEHDRARVAARVWQRLELPAATRSAAA